MLSLRSSQSWKGLEAPLNAIKTQDSFLREIAVWNKAASVIAADHSVSTCKRLLARAAAWTIGQLLSDKSLIRRRCWTRAQHQTQNQRLLLSSEMTVQYNWRFNWTWSCAVQELWCKKKFWPQFSMALLLHHQHFFFKKKEHSSSIFFKKKSLFR